MKMKMLLPVLMALVLLVSCSQTAESEIVPSSDTVSESVSSSESTPAGPAEDDVPGGEQEIIDHPTGDGECTVHTASYHAIPLQLIMIAGSEEYNAWVDSLPTVDGGTDEAINIVDFVQQFNISRQDLEEIVAGRVTEDRLADFEMTKDEYLAAYGYTDAQMDAIYSGDADAVSKAFAAG